MQLCCFLYVLFTNVFSDNNNQSINQHIDNRYGGEYYKYYIGKYFSYKFFYFFSHNTKVYIKKSWKGY